MNILLSEQATKIYSVSELTKEIQQVIENRFDTIWIEAEISNFRSPISGHYYMSLKDEYAQIKAVMFKGQNRRLPFIPKDGIKVIAKGKLSIYPPRGEYQLILEYIEPLGIGALALAFEELKRKLAAQGIFDQSIKKPIPFLPQRVAVITSPTGAAIRDFLKVIRRRFANLEIIIIPVRVQGEGATEEIIKAIEIANTKLDVDIIVITRGGGSIEDLWAFNQEELAFAIRKSKIPVVSAVGHEIDITISDLAADLRSPTPSAAAEILVGEKEALIKQVFDLRQRLIIGIKNTILPKSLEVERMKKAIRDPSRMLQDKLLRIDDLGLRCIRAMKLIIEKKKDRIYSINRNLLICSPLNKINNIKQEIEFKKKTIISILNQRINEKNMYIKRLMNRIKDLSPLSILKRGYSITMRLPEKKILRNANETKKGDRIEIILANGNLIGEVISAGEKNE